MFIQVYQADPTLSDGLQRLPSILSRHHAPSHLFLTEKATGKEKREKAGQFWTLLKQDLAERVRDIPAALAMAETMDDLIREAPPGWWVPGLLGDRGNEWSVSVSGNWRVTFEERDGGTERLNLEDYH